jgi:hypothetical protein
MVRSYVPNNSITFVVNMESKDNSLHPTPRQNGVVKRQNCTITEMAKCMMQNKCVSNRFWAEVVFTIVYPLNRYSTMTMKQKTPKEAWSGRKPIINHLKVFGSTAYA